MGNKVTATTAALDRLLVIDEATARAVADGLLGDSDDALRFARARYDALDADADARASREGVVDPSVAPAEGDVDVRAAHPGEVVVAGQPVVTLINPEKDWITWSTPGRST